MDAVYPNPRTETPPVTDPEMWASVLNLSFWLERDEEFVWLQSVRTAVCPEEQASSKPRVGSA